MSNKTALITGISGQDGSYLAEYLLTKGYVVSGLLRRNSVAENQSYRLAHLDHEIDTHYADVTDNSSLARVIETVCPDEIYNLAAQSHVRVSFDIPEFTLQTNAAGPLSILEILRRSGSSARFYQASSSEMFGNSVDPDNFQRETTPMHPVSPYGCAKLFAYHIVRNYRSSYGLFASNGILFNHESPRRGSNFVTSKIVKTAVEIKRGLKSKLVLGNIDTYRDWGHSRDYVKAMHLILNHEVSDDFVIATGQTFTVRDFLRATFERLDLDYHNHVEFDSKFNRPTELNYLRGDAAKARTTLGWTPLTTFEMLVDEMVDEWLAKTAK